MEIRSVVVISLLESIHCPCSAKNFVREEFNPKLVNRFKLPITDTMQILHIALYPIY